MRALESESIRARQSSEQWEENTGCVLAQRAAKSAGMTHTREMLMGKNRTGYDFLISWRASSLFNKMTEQAGVKIFLGSWNYR